MPKKRRNLTVVDSLHSQAYKSFFLPLPGDSSLTFNKTCRFMDPVITIEGIPTRGQLWAVERLVRAEQFSRRQPVSITARHIADQLEESGENEIARLLNDFPRRMPEPVLSRSLTRSHTVPL